MKQILENSVNTERFSIVEVYNQIFSHSDFIYYQTTLENVFSSKIATHILRLLTKFQLNLLQRPNKPDVLILLPQFYHQLLF